MKAMLPCLIPFFLAAPLQAGAQTADSIRYPADYAPGYAPCTRQGDGTCVAVSATMPLPVTANSRQESFTLAAANTASPATSVYGGAYVISQTCTSYNAGALTVRYRGPDGVTMLTLMSKTASDTTGGTLVSLGSNSIVDVALPSGSTGCAATLARVPQ